MPTDPSPADSAPREPIPSEPGPPCRPRAARSIRRDMLIGLAGFLLGSLIVGAQAILPTLDARTDVDRGAASV